jgi:hypothetical protein
MAKAIAIPMARRKVVLIEVLIVTLMYLLLVVIGRSPAIKSEHASGLPWERRHPCLLARFGSPQAGMPALPEIY